MAKREQDRRAFWTIDAETDPFKFGRVPKPFIWGLYTGAGFHTFAETAQLVEAIKDQDVIVYAHNGGKFDFHLMLDHINLHEDMKVIDGRLVSAHIGKCEIRDSYSLFPAPLRDFGFKKDIEISKLEAKVRHQHMGEIVEYLRQDCVGLWDALDRHEQTYGRHLTQAGASMAMWKKISGLEPPRTDRPFFRKFSPYYFGGRVQVFERGYVKGPFKVWDIRSAYPWAMLSEHPYDPIYHELAFPREVQPADMVKLECVSCGALPHRDARGEITFPRDNERRTYHVTGHEVLAGLETGTIRDVKLLNAIRFIGLRDFAPYINHFYEGRKADRRAAKAFREAGDHQAANAMDVEVFFKKRYMTGLYGKFAANPENYGNFMATRWEDKFDHSEEGYEFNGKIGNLALLRRPLDPWQEHYINLATAASITGQVRAHLWRAITSADGPIYCDTDSVMARAADLPIGEDLGQWNMEGVAHEGWFAGKKLYYLKGQFENGKTAKLASKGVPLDPKNKRDIAKLKAAALGGTAKVRSDAPTFTLKGERQVYFQERTIRATGTL